MPLAARGILTDVDGLFEIPGAGQPAPGSMSGAGTPGAGSLGCQHVRVRPARGADASAHHRRARRPAAAACRRLPAASPHRGRPVDVAAAVGAARDGQDHDRRHRQPADAPALRRGVRGRGRRQGGPRRHRRRPGRAGPQRPGDRALRRRGAPLHQGTAGRPAAGRGEPLGDADRRDHREPVLLGDQPAALAQPAAAPAVADRRRRRRGHRPGAGRRARAGRRDRSRRGGPRAPRTPRGRRRAPGPDLPRGRGRARRRATASTRSTSPPPRPRSTRPPCATTARATSTTT